MIDLMKLYEIQAVSPDDVRVSKFNPVTRTAKRFLAPLLRDIGTDGAILWPLAVGQDGALADGHRRLACAKILKHAIVRVMVLPGDSATLFRRLNGWSRPMTPKMWNEAVALGYPPELVPGREGERLRKSIEILGWEIYQDMALSGFTGGALATAMQIANYVGDSSEEFLNNTLIWIYMNKMQREPINAIKYRIDPAWLRHAVESNEPLALQVMGR